MLQLNHREGRPIYEQVKDGIRRLVITGAVAEGEKLPSIRAMASMLAINPNTIQKAYDALETEGYLHTMPGKGCFAAPATGVEGTRRKELLVQFDTLVAELLYLKVPPEGLISTIDQRGALQS